MTPLFSSSARSKADLHVHSKYSDRPSEWFLRRIGAPECFVEPQEIYRLARQKGMDFVTISDHNCIRGALDIAHLPGTFISVEITTYFPDDGCKIHCLACGINEAQFAAIQELRGSIYDLQKYLAEQDIFHAVTHPLFRINDRLRIDHLEKLLLLFKRFELINGVRNERPVEMVDAVFGNLTPEMIERLADRHNLEPVGPEPWKKIFTGGSDDHSGAYAGRAYTLTPYAEDVHEYLAHLRRGDHAAGGEPGSSIMLGHCLYHIASSYYKSRFLGAADGKGSIVSELFRKLLEPAPETPVPAGISQRIVGLATDFVRARQMRKLGEVEREVVEEFGRLFDGDGKRDAVSPPDDDRRTFQIACRIGHTLSYTFLRTFERYVRQGRLIESLQTVASLGPVAMSMAPYLAAFSTQHKDEAFLQAVASHFPAAAHLRQRSDRKAWVTDTYTDVNGVSRSIRHFAKAARRKGRKLTVVTSLDSPPSDGVDLKSFQPVGTFTIPEYESQVLSFPPFLEVIEYLERMRFNEVIISTPGPVGLTALAAVKLLGLRSVGVYHTDFPKYVYYATQDEALEQLTWKFMYWFYDQMDAILVPSEAYREVLVENGFKAEKIGLLGRGVDTEAFHPSRRDETFWSGYGLDGEFKFLYVGRISREKNLALLLDAFGRLRARGVSASLAMVGDGPHREDLMARNDPGVAFTGVLQGAALAAAYASSDVLVFPSTTDTFGNAVLEAHASGLPAIVSDRGGPADIVRRNQSGLIVDIGKPDALVDAMEQFALSPPLRSKYREQALRTAEESRWEEVFDQLWDGRGGEPDPEKLREFLRPAQINPAMIVMDVS